MKPKNLIRLIIIWLIVKAQAVSAFAIKGEQKTFIVDYYGPRPSQFGLSENQIPRYYGPMPINGPQDGDFSTIQLLINLLVTYWYFFTALILTILGFMIYFIKTRNKNKKIDHE